MNLQNRQNSLYYRKVTKRYKGDNVLISYNKLWKLLIDKDMSKGDFIERCKMSSGTMQSLRDNLPVHLKVIERICLELNFKVEDVLEIMNEAENMK